MNPTLNLTFVYFPEDEEDPVIIGEVVSPVVPRIGDSVLLSEEDAKLKSLPNAWEVIDVFYQLPTLGGGAAITQITVYIDPSEDDE